MERMGRAQVRFVGFGLLPEVFAETGETLMLNV
jgi:hypothetical protein